jgi:hypothetical protein
VFLTPGTKLGPYEILGPIGAAGKNGLYRVAADGSSRPELLQATSTAAAPSSWSPDGKRFLVEQSAASAAGSTGRRMIGVNDWFEELKRRVPVK